MPFSEDLRARAVVLDSKGGMTTRRLMQTALTLGAVHCEIPKTTRARYVARLAADACEERGGGKVAEWIERQFGYVVPSPSFGRGPAFAILIPPLRYAHTSDGRRPRTG